MLKTITDYFYFSQKERRGIFALLTIILLLICINIFFIPQMGNEEPIDKNAYMAWVDSLTKTPDTKVETKAINYFNFDPNKINKENWLKLGLSKDQIKVIFNYQKAGGKFFRKKDLKKIYSISEKQYLALEPYIIIPSSTFINKMITKPILKLELNTADSTDLININGIGPVFSSRIVKYRKLLGGYAHSSQLTEVYGIDTEKYQQLKQHFSPCDTSKITQININTATFKQLLKHPYISYEFVKIIVNERRKKLYQSLEYFKERLALSDSTYNKIKPYLTTEK